MSNTLVLTGCAGFIGLNFLRSYNCSYDRIISIDKMGYATTYNKIEYDSICKSLNIEQINESIESVYKKSLLNFGSDEKITILDFCSESHVDNSIKDPFAIYQENSMIPVYLLNSISNKSQIVVYYHLSTDEVYGDLELYEVENSNNWFNVKNQYKPSNPYSASKVAQDAYLHSMKHTFGLNVKILRLANQYGPYQHLEKMIPASILRALKGENIKVYGNGKNIRQWTYVEDTATIINNILKTDPIRDYIIHIADTRYLFDNNYVSSMLQNKLREKNIMTRIEYVPDRLGHDKAYALSVTPYIDYQYNDSFEKNLENTIDFYIKNFKDGIYGNN